MFCFNTWLVESDIRHIRLTGKKQIIKTYYVLFEHMAHVIKYNTQKMNETKKS